MSNADRLRAKLSETGVSALLLSENVNVGWLTGFTGSFGYALLTADGGVFITDSRYTLQASEEVQGMPVETFGSPMTADEFIWEQIQRLGLRQMHFEPSVTYTTYRTWAEKFGGVELLPAPNIVSPLRMVKTEEEIENVRAACRITDACFQHVLRLIQPGVPELEIGIEIEFYFRRQGLELAFPPIAVSGERSARPHGKPSEKRLQKGDFVTMDFGCRVNGYSSDITRTVVVGEASDRHREIYEQVLKAEVAAIEFMKPGVPAREVDALARRVLGEKDLDKYFGHGLGHGLGRLTHDVGRMNATSEDVLEPGQIWTVEPGVYIEGFGGVRIEDDVVVREDGVEVLTKSPKNLMILPE